MEGKLGSGEGQTGVVPGSIAYSLDGLRQLR